MRQRTVVRLARNGDRALSVECHADDERVGSQARQQAVVVAAAVTQAVARIVTDENGRASTADLHDGATDGALPYGTYEVREDPATTPPGYRAAEPFTVQVDENGRTSFYEVENHLVRASEAPASEHGAEGSALAETGDALGMTPRWTALAAAIGAALAAAAAKRGRRP